MKLLHTFTAMSIRFDDGNLVSSAGLVPIMGLAQRAGLHELGERWLTVPTDKGSNPGAKLSSLVAGMVAGADSIDDMAILKHGGMGKVFTGSYAPSTLGSFLRMFRFGHVRQLDAVASRLLDNLNRLAPILPGAGLAMLDIDDTVVEVHGHAKQGAGFGYNKIRGLNAAIATLATPGSAPMIVAQRLRKGSTSSPKGAKRLVSDAVATTRRLLVADQPVVVRADSGFYGVPTVGAAITGGADVSVTVKLNAHVRRAITTIGDDAWAPIEYPNSVKDPDTGEWISRAEVAETRYTAFTSKPEKDQITGRLVVRRVPDVNAEAKKKNGQDTLFDTWRFHAFFTTLDPDQVDTVAADRLHRHHAIIEQVHADLKNSALAHLPSGVFTANAAWLVTAVIAFNLTRAAAALTGHGLERATTAATRRKLIHVPARIASSARRIVLHLPHAWPWQASWAALFTHVLDPPRPASPV